MVDTLSGKNYQTLLTVKDKRFNVAALSQYHLSICISDASFKVSCVNPTTTQCLFLAAYSLVYERCQQRVEAIEQLYQDHRLLVAGNWSAVTLCISNQQYSLIPKHLFQESNLVDYLDFTCPIGAHTLKHFTHTSLNLTVAFAMDPLIINWFQTTYEPTQLTILHQASSLIEGALSYLRSVRPSLLPRVLVFVEANHLHCIVIQKSNLLYYNRFAYTSSDEFLNYILIVMHTLKLDPGLHEVILGGRISKGSIAYRQARNHIRKLTFIGSPPSLKFRSIFNKEMCTTHWDVLSTYLCHEAL